MLEQAHVLCTKVDDDPTLFQILENLSFVYGGTAIESAASWDRVNSVDKELLDIASRLNDPALMGRARFAHGRTLMWQGIFSAAREEFARASEFSTAVSSRREQSIGDWRVRNHSLASFTLWILGYPEKAVASGKKALSIARRTTLPADLILALNWWAKLNLLLRNGQVARLHTDEASRVASEHGLSGLAALGFDRGQALALIGQPEEGLSEVLRTRSEVEYGVVRPMISAGLAEVFFATCRPSDGLEAVDQGLGFCRSSGSRAFEACLQRLRGELLLMADKTAQAEAEKCFREAIKTAESQRAKSWELRATLSLARLLMKQDRREDARAMLGDIYNWFTEGFDTADLQEAKELLNELAQES
jgi:tetratricopeptide (TPR) repeat protein